MTRLSPELEKRIEEMAVESHYITEYQTYKEGMRAGFRLGVEMALEKTQATIFSELERCGRSYATVILGHALARIAALASEHPDAGAGDVE